jgi:UPF0176 protein
METHILLFYKFVRIEDTNSFKEEHLNFCKNLGIKGKVLIASEGINGSVSGTEEQVEKYKAELRKNPLFSNIEFKEEMGILHPFNKMVVRVKKEIIRLGENIDIKNNGKHVSPREFLEMYERGEDMIVLDARNDYESKVGKFKGAITPNIETFREFPEFVKNFAANKGKKIVMYCTGGIRCEKASAYMIQQGFKNVSQLSGGVIKFCQEFPNTVWEGSCFVFDNRLTSSIGQEEKSITNCVYCAVPCDLYKNCKNVVCNELIVICPECEKKRHSCCSKDCMKILLSKR